MTKLKEHSTKNSHLSKHKREKYGEQSADKPIMIASRRHFATENRLWDLFDRASLSCSTSCLRLWTSYKELIKSLKPSSYSLKGNNFKTCIWFCSRSQLSLILILDCKWDFEKFLLLFAILHFLTSFCRRWPAQVDMYKTMQQKLPDFSDEMNCPVICLDHHPRRCELLPTCGELRSPFFPALSPSPTPSWPTF